MLHSPDLDRMSHAEKDALIMTLFDGFGDLRRRVEDLEGQRQRSSRNSSKPPSSDGLKKKPAQPRKRGEKPNGGQPGHPGQTCRMAEQADAVVDLKPHGHCACGQALADLPGTLKERRQQWDIPPPRILITEYRQHQVACPCGHVHCGEFPAGITPNVSFGPRIKAYAVGLIDGYFVGLQRTAEILQDQYGVRPSEGSLQRWIVQASERLMPVYAAAGRMIQAAKVGHFDESGMHVAGHLRWLHVAASETAVHYSTHENCGREANPLPRPRGATPSIPRRLRACLSAMTNTSPRVWGRSPSCRLTRTTGASASSTPRPTYWCACLTSRPRSGASSPIGGCLSITTPLSGWCAPSRSSSRLAEAYARSVARRHSASCDRFGRPASSMGRIPLRSCVRR
jgi:transposase